MSVFTLLKQARDYVRAALFYASLFVEISIRKDEYGIVSAFSWATNKVKSAFKSGFLWVMKVVKGPPNNEGFIAEVVTVILEEKMNNIRLGLAGDHYYNYAQIPLAMVDSTHFIDIPILKKMAKPYNIYDIDEAERLFYAVCKKIFFSVYPSPPNESSQNSSMITKFEINGDGITQEILVSIDTLLKSQYCNSSLIFDLMERAITTELLTRFLKNNTKINSLYGFKPAGSDDVLAIVDILQAADCKLKVLSLNAKHVTSDQIKSIIKAAGIANRIEVFEFHYNTMSKPEIMECLELITTNLGTRVKEIHVSNMQLTRQDKIEIENYIAQHVETKGQKNIFALLVSLAKLGKKKTPWQNYLRNSIDLLQTPKMTRAQP